MNSKSNRRDIVSVAVLWLGFCLACLFYGVGANLIMLWLACAAPLLVLTVAGPGQLVRRVARADVATLLCLWVLLFLVLSYQLFTLSPDSSFAASWVFASIPLWYLASCSLARPRWLLGALLASVLLLALVSATRFVVSGQRAYEPLADTNNYASLLYLVWIPLMHAALLGAWRRELSRPRGGLVLMGSLILLVALLATGSRVGLLVVLGALCAWWLIAWRRQLSLRPLGYVVLTLVAAYGVFLVRSPELLAAVTSASEIASGASVRSSLNGAAVQIFLEAPVTGMGVFTFALLYPLFRSAGDQSTAGMFVHNDYLQLLLESSVWLLVPLLVLILATIRRLLSAVDNRSGTHGLERTGFALALAALLAHAAVNFVFYVLPIGIVLGCVISQVFPPKLAGAHAGEPAADLRGVAGWLGGVVFAWLAWGYLALDTVTQGVFGGQPGFAFTRSIRADETAMLDYARLARRLNDKRSVPVLGEALVLTAAARREPESAFLLEQIVARYREAIRLDGLNPFVYEQFAGFLTEFADERLTRTLTAEETPELLLLQAVSLDLRAVGTVLKLLEAYDRSGQRELALQFLKVEVFPWLELIARTNTDAFVKLVSQMRDRSLEMGDVEFLDQLRDRATELSGLRPAHLPVWLQIWQAESFR